MVIKVLSKSMDTPLAVDKIEVATLTRDVATGEVGVPILQLHAPACVSFATC